MALLDSGGCKDVIRTLEDEEVRTGQANDRLTAACARMATTPATTVPELTQKTEVVQHLLDEREVNGYPCDSRHRLMLASLMGDLAQWFRHTAGRGLDQPPATAARRPVA
jgi:hypothetical protein